MECFFLWCKGPFCIYPKLREEKKKKKTVSILGTSQSTSRQHLSWESHCMWVFIAVLVLTVSDWKQLRDTIVGGGFSIMMR